MTFRMDATRAVLTGRLGRHDHVVAALAEVEEWETRIAYALSASGWEAVNARAEAAEAVRTALLDRAERLEAELDRLRNPQLATPGAAVIDGAALADEIALLRAERDKLKEALETALEDVWDVESHASADSSDRARANARITEKSMLQHARHKLEAALAAPGDTA